MSFKRFIFIILFFSNTILWGQEIKNYKLFPHRYILVGFRFYHNPNMGIHYLSCINTNEECFSLIEPNKVLKIDKSDSESFIKSLFSQTYYCYFMDYSGRYYRLVYKDYTLDFDKVSRIITNDLIKNISHYSSHGYFHLSDGTKVEFFLVDIQGIFLSHSVDEKIDASWAGHIDYHKYEEIKEVIYPFRIDVFRKTTTLFF